MKLGLKLFFSHWLAVILVSGSIGTFFYINAADSLKASLQLRLRNSAALIAESLKGADIQGIREQGDIEKESYQRNLALLRRLKQTNPDIAFLYITRMDNGKVTFVIDSDESSKQALPGKVYMKGISALEDGFKRPAVDDDFYTDEWGVFMAGYAPVDAPGGPYALGMDMRADEVQRKYKRLQLSGLLSLLASLALAFIFSRVLAQRLVRHIGTFVLQCEAIASGRYQDTLKLKTGDELDQLVTAFNTMAINLSQTQASLRAANTDLELRVQQRTQELTALNDELRQALDNVQTLKGLLPMCAWCKKMRSDDGYWTELEQYVQKQAGVKFTHGICPDCTQKLIHQARQ